MMGRRFGLDIPQALEDACDPAAMAVIVYDMQVGVGAQLPGGGAEQVRLLGQHRDRPDIERPA
jgi:biuret amidohydrolase